jgi:hypothetical protein
MSGFRVYVQEELQDVQVIRRSTSKKYLEYHHLKNGGLVPAANKTTYAR